MPMRQKCKWGSTHRHTNKRTFRCSVQLVSQSNSFTAPIINHCLGRVIIISRFFCRTLLRTKIMFQIRERSLLIALKKASSKKLEQVKEGATLPFDSVCKCQNKLDQSAMGLEAARNNYKSMLNPL